MVLVFDLGATKTRISLVENGKLGEIHRLPTDRSTAGFAKFLGALEEVAGGQKLNAIVGGLPGQLRGDDGELAVATNLTDWHGLEIKQRMGELFDCPIVLGNDVEMGGLGESSTGAGITSGVMVYFTVSTGVNAVRIVDGAVDQTVDWYEVGKQVIGRDGVTPQTLEMLVGGAALEQREGKPPHDVKDKAVWAQIERDLATGLFNAALFWNPELIVLGGSMMVDIDLAHLTAELETLPNVLPGLPKLALAKLGDEGGMWGAARLAVNLGYK